MPNKNFLERYPLYRNCAITLSAYNANKIPKVTIKMECPKCQSDQTFSMENEYFENLGLQYAEVAGQVLRLVYLCAHCKQFRRYFFILVANNGSLTKVGQYPSWDISTDPEIRRMLGEHDDYYKKALICESQSYGIGAFAYYRRIVEEIIDQLLDDITDLLSGEEHTIYLAALEKTKKTKVTEQKIDLVKDLLPPILRPDGMNPLSALHSTLSEGLHSESEDDCMEKAAEIKQVLTFLINQVSASKAASKGFTEGMRKLLDKKSQKKE